MEEQLQKLSSYFSSSFWADTDKSRVLLTLRTRAKQVSGVIGSCHAAFCNIHGAMFPLNQVREGLFRLMRKFCNYDKMNVLIRHQLVAGAKVALAVAKTHNPRLDLDRIKRGPYSWITGRRVDMKPFYKQVTPAAIALVRLAEEEADSKIIVDEDPEF